MDWEDARRIKWTNTWFTNVRSASQAQRCRGVSVLLVVQSSRGSAKTLSSDKATGQIPVEAPEG